MEGDLGEVDAFDESARRRVEGKIGAVGLDREPAAAPLPVLDRDLVGIPRLAPVDPGQADGLFLGRQRGPEQHLVRGQEKGTEQRTGAAGAGRIARAEDRHEREKNHRTKTGEAHGEKFGYGWPKNGCQRSNLQPSGSAGAAHRYFGSEVVAPVPTSVRVMVPSMV
jgi:hypothetical protein